MSHEPAIDSLTQIQRGFSNIHEKSILTFSSIYPVKSCPSKGQIISKQLLASSDSSKQRTNEFMFFCLTVLKTNLFVCFLEESEDAKKFFRNYLTFRKRVKKTRWKRKIKSWFIEFTPWLQYPLFFCKRNYQNHLKI